MVPPPKKSCIHLWNPDSDFSPWIQNQNATKQSKSSKTTQSWRQFKWHHLVGTFMTIGTWWCKKHTLWATFTSNANSATWWPKLELFISYATSWLNLEPIQVTPPSLISVRSYRVNTLGLLCLWQCLHFHRTHLCLWSILWVRVSLSTRCFWDLTCTTLADEDTNGMPTDNANRAIQGNLNFKPMFVPNSQLMQVVLPWLWFLRLSCASGNVFLQFLTIMSFLHSLWPDN